MTISPEAQRVREALLNKGLETPYFDTGKTPEEKMELIAGKMKDVMEIIGLDVSDDSLNGTLSVLQRCISRRSFPVWITAISRKSL